MLPKTIDSDEETALKNAEKLLPYTSDSGTCILCFYPSQANHLNNIGKHNKCNDESDANINNNINSKDEMIVDKSCITIDELFRISPFKSNDIKAHSILDVNCDEEEQEIRQKIYAFDQRMQSASSMDEEEKESIISEMRLLINQYRNLERSKTLNIDDISSLDTLQDLNTNDVNHQLIKSELCVTHGQQNDTFFMSKSMINYIHFGNPRSDPPQFFIHTPDMKWPKEYSFLMWVKWDNKQKREYLTTFDSQSFAPIAVDMSYNLGCASSEKWEFISDLKIKFDEWQFVLVLGGNSCSKYYIGDWSENTDYDVPFVGEVTCDISGQITCRIGNQDQGPGMVACILVFDYQLCSQEIKQFYWETKNEICQQWNHHQIEIIGQLLIQYISVESIVYCIFQFVRSYSY